jgi:hypothetical protein
LLFVSDDDYWVRRFVGQSDEHRGRRRGGRLPAFTCAVVPDVVEPDILLHIRLLPAAQAVAELAGDGADQPFPLVRPT